MGVAVMGFTGHTTKSGSLVVSYAASLRGHLALAIRREAEYPSRPKLRKRLKAIEEAARLLAREVTDVPMLVLLRDGYEGVEHEVSLLPDLMRLAKRAACVRARSPRRQGRGKLYPAEPTALEYCALIVSVAWHMAEGKWPGKDNPEAHLLCEALWLNAGGAPHSGLGARPGTFTAWRNHLFEARQYRPPHGAGKMVVVLIMEVVDEPPPKTMSAIC
jgi:hypothetical protein